MMRNNNPDDILIKSKEFLRKYRALPPKPPFPTNVKLEFAKILMDAELVNKYTIKYTRTYNGFGFEIVLGCLGKQIDPKILEIFKKFVLTLAKFFHKNHKTIEKLFLRKNEMSDEEWHAELKKILNSLEKRNKKLSEEKKKEILLNRAKEKLEKKFFLTNKTFDRQINDFGVDMSILEYLLCSFLDSETLIIIESFKYTRKKVSKNRKNSKKNLDSNETENTMKENDNKE